ncbi:serine-rich adhesin for platelets-like isoform X1 [Amphibalanus amphitrite]|uniref:serine-rich adhesin for platelets-like isoform X1 n=1 Tax=Amphibalanus amphitrite TaxID=1232801 RepID=UPI001C908097|nr:serine-rich adhesin for platelets-like isoform X1 [Amphibalanus amphitrite]
MTQSESEPADERAEKVVEDSVKDSDKISAAEAVEQPLEECSVETAGEPLVAEEKEPEDEAASESVVEAPEVATEVVERAKNIVSETIEKALQQIPLNASQKTVVDAEVAEVIEDVVGSAAEGKGESSEGSTTESPEEIGEPAAKEVRELEEKEEMKEPLTEVIEANQATARTEAVPSPTRRTPPLRLLSTVQEMSVDVLVPTADDVHPDNVTPNSPILEEQKEGEKSENQENNQNEDRKPSTPIEQLSDQPDTLPTPAPHSGDKVSSDPNAEQDPLAEPESPGAAASKDAATTTTIPTGEFPEAAAAVSPRQVSEPKQRSLEQTAAALVAAVVSAAEAALASVDAGGDADQSAQTPNEHNEPNHPDGKPNELAEINASAAEKTEDVEEVVMPDASQVSPEPSDSPDDIPDVQIHDKDSQPEINHVSENSAELAVNAEPASNHEAQHSENQTEPVLARQVNEALESQIMPTKVSPVNAQDDNHTGKDTIPVHSDKPTTPKPSRKISWQERVVVADTFDNAEADEADEEAEELFTPMSPVHEYTPSPPLYRRNTFDELVAVTDVPNSESKREVKIQQKRKLSRKESRLRHSRSRSSSGDLESPVPKDSCIERNEHPLNFALDKDVSDEEKHSAAAVDVAAVQVVAAERLPDEKVLDQSDHSNEKTEAAVKHEKNRKISFIEKIDVIEVPVVKPEDSKTEEKFDPHPKLVIQDSIDEPADWIHAPLSESKKELEVLEKVCEDNEEQTESQLPLQSDTNITPMNDKDVQSAADKTPAEPFEQPNGNRQPSVETPANEEQSEDKATLSHVIDRSRLLQKNIILSMSTSSSDSDEEAAHMSDGQRKKSQKTSDESSSSSDDGKSSASKAAVKSDDKNEPKLDTNDGAVKEHKEEGIPKRVGHDESSSPSEGDDANEALQKEKTVPSSTASGQGHPCVPLEDTSAKKKTKSNSEGSESSTSSSDKNEATKNASQNKKKKKKKRRKRSSGSSSSSDDSSVTKQSRKKDKAKPKLTSSGSSSSSSDDSKAKAEKLQQKKKETSSSSSDTDKHESSAEKGASKKDDVSERSKTSSGSEKRASKSRSVSSSSSGSSLDHNGSQKEASKEDKPASKPESRKSSTSSSDNNKKGEALQEEKDRPNTSDSSTSSSSSDDSSTEKKLPKKDSRKTTSRSSRSSNSSSDDKDAAVEAATKKEEAKSSSKSSSSSSSDEGKCDKKRSMKDKAMPKRATSRSSSSCSDDREGKGNTTQQRNATVKPKCSESADTSSNADSDREGFSKEEKAKLKKQSSKSSSSSSDDNAATTEVKRKNKSKSSSTTSTSSSSSTDDDKAQNKALKKKKNTSRSASSSSSSDGSKRNKSTSQKKKAQSGQATSSSSSSSSDDSSVEQKDAKKDKSNMKSASPKGSSSTSDEETRKRHTSPKPANSKDSSSSAEDNVTCGNYANEKEKSKKRELSPARTSSHSETKSACQGSNAEKESMLEEQVKLRSSSSISSSTSEDEGKPLDRSRENAAMTEKQDDMPHTDDISDDRNQIKLEVCVNEQPSSSVADDIESQVKLPSLELATTSDVSENKAAENDTEVKDKYVPSSAETLEVKVNILAETGDSAQETAPETEAIKNIEVSVDISLGQQLVRSRSDVEDDAETQERPMTVTVLPSCAHIRPDEPKSKGRSDSESSSISEEIGVQEETQKTGTCTETPVIRDTTPGDSLGENKTGDEVEVPIDVDQELDFDVVGLVSNVVNESRSPVHLTTQGEIQDSPVIVEKIVTDVTQENAPLGKDDALERRSSTSSESSSSGSDGEKGGKMNVDAPISDLVPTSKEDVIVRCDEQKTENQPAAPMPKSEVLEDSAEEQQVDAGKNDMQDSPLPSTNETSSPKSEEETQQSKETSEPNQSFSDNEYQTKETNLPTFAVDDQTGKQWRKKSRTSDTSSSSSPSDDSEDSIKAKTSEAAHEKIVRASSSSSSSETSAEQDEKLSPEKTPNVIEDLCDAIIPEKPSSASHEDKNVVKKEGSNEKKNDVKTEDPTVSNTSSSSHSSESSVDDHRRDSAEHNEKQDMVKQEDEPSTVSLDIEVDIMKEVDKPAGESGKSPEPETSVVLETHMASQFAVAEEFPSSDSEDQEAHEVIIGIDKVEPTQAVERQSPPATEVVNAEMEAENGIDDGTFGKKERTTVEVASSCDEGERNSVPESQDDSLAILVTKIVPNENESQEEILTEVTKSELDQTPQHIPTPLDDISQLPVSVPKEEISLFQSPECLSETPKTIAESFDNKTETQESLKPAAPSSLPASTKPSRKYSDQYSNFETPRDSRYRLQDMQERSKSSVGQQRTRIRPQVEVTSAVLPCLVEVRTALPPSGIPSEVLENMENVTDVMKEEKPPKVAELIVPETLTNVNQGNKEMESLPVGDNVVEVSLEQHLSAMDEKHSPAAVSSSSSSSSDSEENKAKTDKSQDCEKEKKTPKKETERKSRASSSSTSSSSDSDENRKRRKTSRKSSSSSSDSSARKHKIDKRKDSASKQPVAVKKEKQKRSSSSSSSDSHEKRQHRKSDTLATAEVGDKVAISTSSDSSSDEGATKSHRRNSVEKEGRKPSSSDKEETAPDLKDKRKPTKTSSSSGTSSSSSSSSSDENAKPEKEASKSSSSTSSSSSSSEDDVKNSHTHDRRKKKSHGSSSDDTEVKKSTEKKEKVNRSGSSVSSSSDKEGSQAKTSGSEKGHPSRPHKTSESSKSSDSSSSDSRSSDSENEAKKRKDVSSVPDVKEATDEPHPKLPLAPPPTSRLPLQTSRDEEILEIVEKVLEDSEIGSLDRNAPSSAIHESIDGKNDADQMKDDALPTSDQNGLEDWVIVPETVDETQAAPHIVNEKTRDPELTQHESSNLHGPTPETISKEEPVEGERGQPVSEWVNMWDSAISAGLYPTPTADVSKDSKSCIQSRNNPKLRATPSRVTRRLPRSQKTLPQDRPLLRHLK